MAKDAYIVGGKLNKLPLYPAAITDVTPGNAGPITDTTSTEVLAAPGSGYRWHLHQVVVTNGSQTIDTAVSIKSASTLKKKQWAQSCGGGWSAHYPANAPLVFAENEAINAQCGTTGASVYVSVNAIKMLV